MPIKKICFFVLLSLVFSVNANEEGGTVKSLESNFGEMKDETTEVAAPPVEVKTTITLDPRLEAVGKTETLYFSLDLNLLSDTKKEDLGVSDLKNVTDAVTDAWKNWGKKEFSDFKNFENYSGDLDFKSQVQHPKNVLVLFKANVRRLKRVGVQEKIDIEVGAEYVVVQLSNKKILGSFDYPYIHRSFDGKDQKALASAVASLFYNLLNAKSGEISTQIKTMLLIPGDTKELEYGISGAKNLIEINRLSIQLKDWESKNRSLCTFSNKISSFSLSEAKIVLSSTCNDANLTEVLKSMGKTELSLGRSFHFLPDQKTFEINDEKAENNPKKETATP